MSESRCPICRGSIQPAGVGEASVAGRCSHNAAMRHIATLTAERDRMRDGAAEYFNEE